jgi:hypothetical protein
MDTPRTTITDRIGRYDIAHFPGSIALVGTWFAINRATQIHDQVFRTREEADGIPPATHFVSSPHDHDAHLAKKGSTCWVGYKVHLTETCEDDAPNLITHVETTPAPVTRSALTCRTGSWCGGQRCARP